MPKSERGCRHGVRSACGMGNVYRFIEPAILLLLAKKDGSYGYELAEGIEGLALADSPVDRPALYRTLRTLEANGFVVSEWETQCAAPSRRVYCLTASGGEHLREWSGMMERLGSSLLKFSRQVERTL